jgi:hypothetical protein
MPGFAECGSYDNGVLPTAVAPRAQTQASSSAGRLVQPTTAALHQRSPAAAGAGTRQGRVPHSAAGGRQGTAGGGADGGTQLSRPGTYCLGGVWIRSRGTALSKCSLQVWNVPYLRTGRSPAGRTCWRSWRLAWVRERRQRSRKRSRVWVMGGTSLAVEYVYRHQAAPQVKARQGGVVHRAVRSATRPHRPAVDGPRCGATRHGGSEPR